MHPDKAAKENPVLFDVTVDEDLEATGQTGDMFSAAIESGCPTATETPSRERGRGEAEEGRLEQLKQLNAPVAYTSLASKSPRTWRAMQKRCSMDVSCGGMLLMHCSCIRTRWC